MVRHFFFFFLSHQRFVLATSLFIFLVFCIVFVALFVFVLCLVINVAHVSGLSFHDCIFDFRKRLFKPVFFRQLFYTSSIITPVQDRLRHVTNLFMLLTNSVTQSVLDHFGLIDFAFIHMQDLRKNKHTYMIIMAFPFYIWSDVRPRHMASFNELNR